MGAFIGPLGGLIEATQWQENQSVSTGTDPSFFTGLDGARTAFVQPPAGRTLREWSVSMSKARPEQAAAFQALAMGAMGIGPFVFADPLAQVTNLLTPRESLVDPVTLSGGVSQSRTVVPGLGSMPAALTSAGTTARFGAGTPALPGRAVTVSAWVVSPQSVTVTAQCMTASGSWTNGASATATALAGGRWVSATVTPAAGSAQVELRIQSGNRDTVACPAISWTRQPMVWSPGRGAKDVVVHGLEESFDRASPRPHGSTWLDYSATVTEVGSGA